jgi:phospholipase/carboxylesterase
VQILELAGLTVRITGPADAALTCVLLHGFGAPGDDLMPIADELGVANVRFVFPAAPLELGGLYGDSRAWWLLDLAKLERELASGTPRDRRGEIPEGMPAVRDQMSRLLDQLIVRFQIAPDRLVLGGFSQGAMLALDVALHRPTKPAALVLMSGTLLADSEWSPRMPSLAGVPVVLSHGKTDTLLPFSIAELLRDRLREAGAAVEWVPFVGGHEIPRAVLGATAKLLARAD